MPEILEFARTTRWAELTAEATNKPLMLNFEAGGDDGCQEELVDALSTLLEKTGDETDWVTRKEIYHRIYSYDSGLWSKMEHIEFQDSTDFKKVRAAKLPFAPPSHYQSQSTPLHPAFQAHAAIESALVALDLAFIDYRGKRLKGARPKDFIVKGVQFST